MTLLAKFSSTHFTLMAYIVYLLHVSKRVLFAFDVDDETVVTINLPGNGYIYLKIISKSPGSWRYLAVHA